VPRSRRGHAISFWTGWASLVLGLGPPLELWTDRSFAAHMAQHEILMLIAAPLLVAVVLVAMWLKEMEKRAAPARTS
jgi:putative membrane protein